MEDRDIQNCIYDVAKQLGIKIRSLQRNPLTNVWLIDIFERNEQIRFKPTTAATTEECGQQFRALLGFHEPVLSVRPIIFSPQCNS